MSRVTFHEPPCFRQISRYFPESDTAGAPGGAIVIV